MEIGYRRYIYDVQFEGVGVGVGWGGGGLWIRVEEEYSFKDHVACEVL